MSEVDLEVVFRDMSHPHLCNCPECLFTSGLRGPRRAMEDAAERHAAFLDMIARHAGKARERCSLESDCLCPMCLGI